MVYVMAVSYKAKYTVITYNQVEKSEPILHQNHHVTILGLYVIPQGWKQPKHILLDKCS